MMNDVIFVEERETNESHDEQIYLDIQVKGIIEKYVCARCWGTLIATHAHQYHYLVFCPDCGPGFGFHTRYFAQTKQVYSYWDYVEAFNNLKDVLGLKEKPFDENKALKDLGY